MLAFLRLAWFLAGATSRLDAAHIGRIVASLAHARESYCRRGAGPQARTAANEKSCKCKRRKTHFASPSEDEKCERNRLADSFHRPLQTVELEQRELWWVHLAFNPFYPAGRPDEP